jgi:alpha-L-fucosidase 2
MLKKMLTDISLHPRKEDSDRVPSMEGNQGIQGWAAGLAEMLLQSHSGEIVLLPALPKAWPNGYVKGLRGRGGLEIDIVWRDSRLKQATIRSKYEKACTVRYDQSQVSIPLRASESVTLDQQLHRL